MKSLVFNGLIMATAVALVALLIRAMPDRRASPTTLLPLTYSPVLLEPVDGPLHLAGAWTIEAPDRRLGGLSALVADDAKFLAVSDRGTIAAFDRPGVVRPKVRLSDLRQGPGPFGEKRSRDAESIVRDPAGRGWWIGFEQRHSIWLYDSRLERALATIRLPKLNWRDNGGAEGLTIEEDNLLVLGESGRDAISIGPSGTKTMALDASANIADATTAPDGSIWVLLRQPGIGGLAQSIAPLRQTAGGWNVGSAMPLPKAPLDNYEGMLIEQRGERWRFWLVSDNDFRSVARTLLVALDYSPHAGHNKSPATGTGLSK